METDKISPVRILGADVFHISFDGFLIELFFGYVWYCVRSGHNFTKSKSPLIYQTNSKVTTRSYPEKTAMKWTTELSPERISMIEGICRKSMEKFGYANYSNSQMTLTDILSKKPQWTKIVKFHSRIVKESIWIMLKIHENTYYMPLF